MAQDILFCCGQRLFFSDGSQYTVGLDGDRKLILDKPYIVRCDANTKGPETDTMDPQTFIKNERQALTPHTFHRAGYCFDGWNIRILMETAVLMMMLRRSMSQTILCLMRSCY